MKTQKEVKQQLTNVIEVVTPAKAERWLNQNTVNRKLRNGVVEQYANDMTNNKWTRCIVPISFYEDGTIADGQHRLWAVVESKTSQKFFVMRGLNKEDGLNIDTGLNRTLVDNARISGGRELTANAVSAARSIEEGKAVHGRRSNAERLEKVDRHFEAANFAANHVHGKSIGNGAILGAVGRAWYAVKDKDKLTRFCIVLRNGLPDGPHEFAAVALRNYLLATPSNGTSSLWRDTFLKTQHAIKAFVAGKPLSIIKNVTSEAYPLEVQE
jgi:hypothetical protein